MKKNDLFENPHTYKNKLETNKELRKLKKMKRKDRKNKQKEKKLSIMLSKFITSIQKSPTMN